jgi:hypothetical protein
MLAKKIHHVHQGWLHGQGPLGPGVHAGIRRAQSDRMEKHFPESINAEIHGI